MMTGWPNSLMSFWYIIWIADSNQYAQWNHFRACDIDVGARTSLAILGAGLVEGNSNEPTEAPYMGKTKALSSTLSDCRSCPEVRGDCWGCSGGSHEA